MALPEIVHGKSAMSRAIWSDTRRIVRDQRKEKIIECPELKDLSSFIELQAPAVNPPDGYRLGYRITEEKITVNGERVERKYISYICARR